MAGNQSISDNGDFVGHPVDSGDAAMRLAAALALALGICLFGFRAIILREEFLAQGLFSAGLTVIAASIQDWILALGFMGFAMLLLWRPASIRASSRAGPWSVTLVAALAGVLLVWGLANIRAVQLLSGPVTLSWVQFSGLAESGYMIGPVLSEITPFRLTVALMSLLVYAILVWGFTLLLDLMRARRAGLLLAGGLPVILAASIGQFQPLPDPGKLRNATLAFAASALSSGPDTVRIGALLAEAAEGPPQLPQPSDKFSIAGVQSQRIARPPEPDRPLESLVLVVLESTGIKAVNGYPDSIGATPNLERYAHEMGLFVTDAYAHVPSSAFSLASLIAGIEPDLWAASMTVGRDDLQVEGLATLVKGRVARSAFLDSSDKRFQNAGGFALRAGFESVLDLHDWDCALGISESSDGSGASLNKAHDLCTFNAAIDWIRSEPTAPFFLTIWTGMAHYPYMPGAEPQAYVDDPSRNDYLNAVRTTDAAFAVLIEDLRANGLLDTTLIVVVGDHGEAFGEHGQYGHATGLWEENLRVPLVLLNPQLFPEGRREDHIASLTDVPPTIADLFGLPVPDSWHGSSLFAADRPAGLFLFAPWAGLQLGFRQGDLKFIFDAHTGKTLLYDLAADPQEANDLSASQPALRERARADLARWVIWQTAFRSQRSEAFSDARQDDPVLASAPAPATAATQPVTIRAAGTMFQSHPMATLYLDGIEVGGFTVSGALSNAEAAVSDEALEASFADYSLTIQTTDCPRQLEIEFLNDEWAGEGLTGDTDLFVDSVTVGETTYSGRSFRAVTDGVGGDYWGKFRMARTGRMAVDLAISENCLAAHMALP